MFVYGSGFGADSLVPFTSNPMPGGTQAPEASVASVSTPFSNTISTQIAALPLSITVGQLMLNVVAVSSSLRPRNFAAGPSEGPLELPPHAPAKVAMRTARRQGARSDFRCMERRDSPNDRRQFMGSLLYLRTQYSRCSFCDRARITSGQGETRPSEW